MNQPLTCGDARDLLPDLALGMLSGDDRAHVLDHLGTCVGCEAETNELSYAVDDLLRLTPEMDPPAGFESAVLARMAAGDPIALDGRRWRRSRVLIVGLAAAAVLIAGGSWGVVAMREHDPGVDDQYVKTIRALGGKELRAAPLVSGRARWGQVFVFEGRTSWVFVSMSWDVPNGEYHVVVDRSDGPSATIAQLRLVQGQGSAGTTVGDTRTLTAVRVVDSSGRTVCTATMPENA